jgi:hypothetical protein
MTYINLGIRIYEEARLKNRIWRRHDTRDESARCECELLNLREVVLRIFVQPKFANFYEGIVLVRPNLGGVENVVLEVCRLLQGHDLLKQI